MLQRLEEVRAHLEMRLREGERRIAAARAAGHPVQSWEDLWVALLREYEAVCDALEEAAGRGAVTPGPRRHRPKSGRPTAAASCNAVVFL